MARPLLKAIFEDLKHGWANIVFGVKPRYGLIGMERSRPQETAIRLKLHAEQGIRQAGEVVVVDARVDERRGKANLCPVSRAPGSQIDLGYWRSQRLPAECSSPR